MPSPADTVAIISGSGANDALSGLMRPLARIFEAHDLSTEFFDLAAGEAKRLGPALQSGRVRFAVTYLGIGQDLALLSDSRSRNAWDALEVPLLKLHGDIGAYFLERQADVPRTSVNLYVNREFLEFHRWALPHARCISAVIEPFLPLDLAPERIAFEARRRGTLVFVKNGADPDALIRLWWAKLPEALAADLTELAHAARPQAMRCAPLHLHEIVLEHLATSGIDPRGLSAMVRLYVAQLDDYFRRVKATTIARALLPLPVVIQGAGWDHLDWSGARAKRAPAQDFSATEQVFREALGIVDMSPNIDSSGHERTWRAAGAYAFALTNRSSWLAELAPALNGAAFEFDVESVRAQAEHALAKPDDCIELGRSYGAAFRRAYPPQALVHKLVLLAEAARIECAKERPQLQPYFAW